MGLNMAELAEDVRVFMQDDPILNRLLGRREFGPASVKLAIRMMISDFNQVNFVSGFTPATFPDNTLTLQIYGTVYHLMNSATVLQTRNHLPYNDSGLSVGQFAKSGEYSGLADRFKPLFDEKALQVKWDINVYMGSGGVMSEYSYFGGWATVYGHTLQF